MTIAILHFELFIKFLYIELNECNEEDLLFLYESISPELLMKYFISFVLIP